MKSLKLPLLLVGVLASILILLWFARPQNAPVREVPYFDPIEEGLKENIVPGEHHKVSDFKLVNQAGDTVTRKDFEGKLTVIDFFFTTCQGICPRMTTQMFRVYQEYKGNEKVKFISHTVNPENDSVPVMATYARKYSADVTQWHFVTGDKPQIYNLARKSYLVSDSHGDGSKEDFVHSQNFALVDGEGHIRGIYDGTSTKDVDRLISEIRILLNSSEKK